MKDNIRPIMKNKGFGAFLFFVGILGFAVIIMRVVFYEFEYDPVHYPVDYGRFNFFSYFTVQSNLYVAFYLLCMGLAIFGKEKAQKIAFNPLVRLTVTTYILVTGAVYCGGIPIGMTPPLSWDNFQHIMLGSVQVFHHMIMPPFMLVLFLIPTTGEKIKLKQLPIVGIYPLVYSVLSIIRGAVFKSHFFVYPFYKPEFFWNMLLKGREMNSGAAYMLLVPMLFLGIGVFLLLALILSLIYNRICEKTAKKTVEI
ncbi:MAG: Pr6Pr family membrane protein [Eubacterium sp.]|nr:Pr6Pr family membrane protein [Eubacterium sp.]